MDAVLQETPEMLRERILTQRAEAIETLLNSPLSPRKVIRKVFGNLIYPKKNEIIQNPYSGAKVTLEPTAVALYDLIKGCEMLKKYDTMNEGLRIFAYYWASEYMELLD